MANDNEINGLAHCDSGQGVLFDMSDLRIFASDRGEIEVGYADDIDALNEQRTELDEFVDTGYTYDDFLCLATDRGIVRDLIRFGNFRAGTGDFVMAYLIEHKRVHGEWILPGVIVYDGQGNYLPNNETGSQKI